MDNELVDMIVNLVISFISMPETGAGPSDNGVSKRSRDSRKSIIPVPIENVGDVMICDVCMDQPVTDLKPCECSLRVCVYCIATVFRTRSPDSPEDLPACPGCRRVWPYEIAKNLVRAHPEKFAALTKEKVEQVLSARDEDSMLAVLGRFILQQKEVLEQNIGVPADNFSMRNLPLWSVVEEMNRKLQSLENKVHQLEGRVDDEEENIVRLLNRPAIPNLEPVQTGVSILKDQLEQIGAANVRASRRIADQECKIAAVATGTSEVRIALKTVQDRLTQTSAAINQIQTERRKRKRSSRHVCFPPEHSIAVVNPVDLQSHPIASTSREDPIEILDSDSDVEIIPEETTDNPDTSVEEEVLRQDVELTTQTRRREREPVLELPVGSYGLERLDYVMRFRVYADGDLATPEIPMFANFTKNQNLSAVSKNWALRFHGQIKRCSTPVTVITPWRVREEEVVARQYIDTILYGHHMERRPVFHERLYVIDHPWWKDDLLLGQTFGKYIKGYKEVSEPENVPYGERAENRMYVEDHEKIRSSMYHSKWNFGRYRSRMDQGKYLDLRRDIRAGTV